MVEQVNDRPKVEVNTTETDDGTGRKSYRTEVRISRDNKAQTHTGGGYGKSRDEAVKESIESIIADPTTDEWLPEVKKS